MAVAQEIFDLAHLALVCLKERKAEEAATKVDEALRAAARASHDSARCAITELNRQRAELRRSMRVIRKEIETFPEPIRFDAKHLLDPVLRQIEDEDAKMTAEKRRLTRLGRRERNDPSE